MKDQIKLAASVANGNDMGVQDLLHIDDGEIYAMNRKSAIMIRCDELKGISVTAEPKKIAAAFSAVRGDANVKQTAKGVTVSGGGVRVNITGVADEYTKPEPGMEKVEITDPIVDRAAKILPFCGIDDVRVYLNGVYFSGTHAYASQGHYAAKIEAQAPITGIIPRDSVAVMAKLGNPESVCDAQNYVTFHYPWGWFRASKIDGKYPNVDAILAEIVEPTKADAMRSAIETAAKFCDASNPVVIGDGKISDKNESIEIDADINGGGRKFNCAYLVNVLSVADEIDLSGDHNKAAQFSGDKLIGCVMGVR